MMKNASHYIRRGMLFQLLWLLPALASAQRFHSPYGQHFFIAFPDTLQLNVVQIRPPIASHARIVLVAEVPAQATIRAGGYIKTVIVPAGKSTVIDLTDPTDPAPWVFVGSSNAISTRLFEITSDKPIAAICYFATFQGSEAFVPLPVESWGIDYEYVGPPGITVADVTDGIIEEKKEFLWRGAPPEILIVAAEDTTIITMTHPRPVDGTAVRTMTLNRGEAYLYRPTSDAGSGHDFEFSDLTGTHITSSKPVGIIAGNSRYASRDLQGNVGTDNTRRNSLVEWLPPVDAAGTRLLFPGPWRARVHREWWRNQSEDELSITGTTSSPTVISLDGQSFTTTAYPGERKIFMILSSPSYPYELNADKPILGIAALQAAPQDLSSDASYKWPAAAATLAPPENWIIKGHAYLPDYPSDLTHLLLVFETKGARIKLDGNVLTAQPVYTSPSYDYFALEVAAGDHMIEAEDGVFSAIAYGFSQGVEQLRPMKAKKDEASEILHKVVYGESMGVAYAYPVPGIQRTLVPSRLTIRCDDTLGELRLTNWGSAALAISDLTITGQIAPYLAAPAPGSVTIEPGSALVLRLTLPVTAPPVLHYTFRGYLQQTEILFEDSLVITRLPTISATVSIPNDLVCSAGDSVVVPVKLDSPIDNGFVTRLTTMLRYNRTLMRPIIGTLQDVDAIVDGTITGGWSVRATEGPGMLTITATAPAGSTLQGAGILFRPRFATYLGLQSSSAITPALATSSSCIEVSTRAGALKLTSCGLTTRMIEIGTAKYSLAGNVPEPFHESTTIAFSTPFAGHVRLEIYDAMGRLTSTPLDDVLDAGRHQVTVNASELASGVYHYRLIAPGWSSTRRMTVAR